MGMKQSDYRTGRDERSLNYLLRRADTLGERNKRGKGRVKGDTNTRQSVKASLRRDSFINY